MGLGSRPPPVFLLAAKLVRSSRLPASELWAADALLTDGQKFCLREEMGGSGLLPAPAR
jgi:hypothetical protein